MTRATCRFESYGYSKQELLFDWVATGNQVNVNISLAQFDVSTSLVALTVPNILLSSKIYTAFFGGDLGSLQKHVMRTCGWVRGGREQLLPRLDTRYITITVSGPARTHTTRATTTSTTPA